MATQKTTAEIAAVIVASTNTEAAKSNLIAGSTEAWNQTLAPFGLTTDDPTASAVMDAVTVTLCRMRGVEITL